MFPLKISEVKSFYSRGVCSVAYSGRMGGLVYGLECKERKYCSSESESSDFSCESLVTWLLIFVAIVMKIVREWRCVCGF